MNRRKGIRESENEERTVRTDETKRSELLESEKQERTIGKELENVRNRSEPLEKN